VSLLVRIARSDGNYDRAEKATILELTQERFGLAAGPAADLVNQAEQLEAEAPDTVRFTRAIKDAVAYEDRLGVIEALWTVVMADGDRDPAEDALLRLTASLLGITDKDSHSARLRVAKG
jgi:uncharacterized tellurite resistance protein B-like protein